MDGYFGLLSVVSYANLKDFNRVPGGRDVIVTIIFFSEVLRVQVLREPGN